MKRRTKKGFTLVEILIVVIILGILAAMVLPLYSQTSASARVSQIKTNLQMVRAQMIVYKTQHLEHYPTITGQFTQYSDMSGGTATTADSTHTLGPYLQSFPVNPVSGLATVRVVTGNGTAFSAPSADGGWYMNSTTGEFRADLRDSWVDEDGTKYNAF
jgi:general secretion pathway protein G